MASANKISLDDMWKTIEQYGIKRDSLDHTDLTEETISKLYQMIKKNREMKRDNETVKRLQEYIKKIKKSQ